MNGHAGGRTMNGLKGIVQCGAECEGGAGWFRSVESGVRGSLALVERGCLALVVWSLHSAR